MVPLDIMGQGRVQYLMVQMVKTDAYDKWFGSLKSQDTRDRIRYRLRLVSRGNFGDHKSVGDGVYELRCTFGGGIRIYYAYNGKEVILLLAGGNKGTQNRDIANAKAMLQTIRKGI